MSKECRFITKLEIIDYKKIMNDLIPKVRNEFKKNFGFSFNFMMVGSAKRRLVVVKGESKWDIDYQIVLNSFKVEKEDCIKIKSFLIKSFEKHLDKKNYSINNSNSVITIILKDPEYGNVKKSFDIAIIKNIHGEEKRQILRRKSNNPKDENRIRWEDLRHETSTLKRKKEIKGSEMWKILREIYKEKKCKQYSLKKNNKEIKDSESLFAESIKETLEKFYLLNK